MALLIRLSIDGHLACFYFLSTVNNATLNMGAQTMQVSNFTSFG